MNDFVGRISDLDGTPICDVEGEYEPVAGPHEGYSGNFDVPGGFAGKVRPGANVILDVDGGPRLQVIIENGQYSGSGASAVEFTSQGRPLTRGAS
jgi:hypothetical protein